MPLLLPAIGWLIGLALARVDMISLTYCVYFTGFLLLFLLKWRKPWLVACLLGLIYGLSSMLLDVQRVAVDASWLGKKIVISATIDEVVDSKQYTRLRLKDVQRGDGATLAGFADVYVYQNWQTFTPDTLITARVKFHVPRNKLNPQTFDYAHYAFERHIAVIGSVSGHVKVTAHDISYLESLRQRIRTALISLDNKQQGVLLALLLADRSKIPLDIDDAFAASGATHLLAISGLHMGLVAGWGFMLMWWLVTRRENWIVRLPVRAAALSAGVLLAMAYATLAGWPIPAQRASLMLLAGVVAWWFRANQVPLNTMFLALILMTLLDPAAVLSISLWLSFTATSALLIWAGGKKTSETMFGKAWMWLKAMLWVSILASLATLPLIGFIFERLPAWSLLANALLVPLYALWVLPLALFGEVLALLGLPGLALSVFQLSGSAIAWGSDVLLYIQTLPAGNLWVRSDLPWVFSLLAVLLIAVGILWARKHRKWTIIMLIFTLISYALLILSNQSIKTTKLHVWDVGQGASAMLNMPDFSLLVDAPGRQGSKYNGGTIAADHIRALGMLSVDAVVLSHAQSDHAGGISRLLASLNGVGELWLADVPDSRNYPVIQSVMDKVEIRWLKKGDHIKLQNGSTVDVLWPPKDYQPSNGNNASLVLLVRLATGQTILLPGDMQKHVEYRILKDLEPVDVMLMPHHGSKTSSTAAFVKMSKPKTVIAQTGYKNHYGFPKHEVVQRYQNVGSQIWNTADGAVSISFHQGDYHVKQFELLHIPKRDTLKYFLFE